MIFKVREFTLVGGVMCRHDTLFPTLAEARAYADTLSTMTVKIFNSTDRVVYSKTKAASKTVSHQLSRKNKGT